MAGTKTKATDTSVDVYITSRANERQAADCRQLMALFKRITGQSPKMWVPSIVGYGSTVGIVRSKDDITGDPDA